MKAWRIYGWGDMRLDDVPEPLVRPGWVKARIRTVQPSITETLLFDGIKTYGFGKIEQAMAAGPAQVFGHEFSAEVVEAGAGVTALRPGMRVAARGSHPDGIVGFDYPGALAEYGLFPESLLCPLPDHVSDSEGAAIQPLTDAAARSRRRRAPDWWLPSPAAMPCCRYPVRSAPTSPSTPCARIPSRSCGS